MFNLPFLKSPSDFKVQSNKVCLQKSYGDQALWEPFILKPEVNDFSWSKLCLSFFSVQRHVFVTNQAFVHATVKGWAWNYQET